MAEVITLKITPRGEDYVFVSCDDLPGLWLWGHPETVSADLEPAIRTLYKANRGLEVTGIRELESTETSRTLEIEVRRAENAMAL